ncbi:MAG: YraN family protein [Peptococcaceae bacterium]|nr:YraN family protein [Peptococcaceae bacterium]
MTREKISLGRSGEDAAVRYLRKKGLRVLERNFRCKLGELDVVAREGPCLVFVEVRTVAGTAFGTAQESVDVKKMRKVRQVAAYYIQSRKAVEMPVRFDVVAVTMNPDGHVRKIEHIVNAF